MEVKTKLHFSTKDKQQSYLFPVVLNPSYVEKLISQKEKILPKEIINYEDFKLVIEEKKECIMEDAVYFLDNIDNILEEYFSESNISYEFKESFLESIKKIKNNDTTFFDDYVLKKESFSDIGKKFNLIFLDSLEKYAFGTSKNIFRRDYLFNKDEDSINEFLESNNTETLIMFCINKAMSYFGDYIDGRYEFCKAKKRLKFEDLFN
jgi:hypothetical protein